MSEDLFSYRLKLLRSEKNISLEYLASKVGTSKAALSRYEKGERSPKIPIVGSLADFFGVNVAWLAGLSDEREIKSTITSIYNELEPTRQQKVYNFAEHELKEQKNKVVKFPNKDKNELKLYSERKAKFQPLAEIDLLGAAAAGTGEFVLEEHVEKISLPENIIPHSADFCLIVNGNSMAPVILNGSYVFIDKTNEIPSGTISAVMVNGEAYIKRVWFENGHARLESFNDKYEDIIVTEEDDFHIIGKVVM